MHICGLPEFNMPLQIEYFRANALVLVLLSTMLQGLALLGLFGRTFDAALPPFWQKMAAPASSGSATPKWP